MNTKHYDCDVLVIGGGVNGAGIALDAAGRGLSVTLCEMGDLASSTSSNSSKLIHGGLRYLEYYEFRLVREALAEREVLLHKAPHIIWPLRFRLPHRPHLRPAWMIRAGLFLYDHLAKRVTLKGSHGVKFGPNSPLAEQITHGFEYSDAWVDDARLVVLNAMGARDKGANILTRTRCTQARRVGSVWEATLENLHTGTVKTVRSRALVNAAGPWVVDLFEDALASKPPKSIRLVKGSHIIVPRIHNDDHAYILQNEDNRIVFVIPYEERFSLIGTTDVEYRGDPSTVSISDDEVDYLITIVNEHFQHKICSDDIVSTYSGVRPLLDDESDSPEAVTRDYTFEMDQSASKAPLLSVFGGKITTYRKLAEAAVDSLVDFFPAATAKWTAYAPLPGGDFANHQRLLSSLRQQYPWLPLALARRFVRSYGTLSMKLLSSADSLDAMGRHFGSGLYQREVDYLIEYEWAQQPEDILWRRSKLGLFLTESERYDLKQYFQNRNQEITSLHCMQQ